MKDTLLCHRTIERSTHYVCNFHVELREKLFCATSLSHARSYVLLGSQRKSVTIGVDTMCLTNEKTINIATYYMSNYRKV